MSAPTTHDPLTVTTADGTAWTRRAVTRGGRGLYAPTDVKGCPQYVIATLVELAEHGIRDRGEVAAPSECERLRARLAESERKLAAERAKRADEHDDLVHALGCPAGMEWSDLVDMAAVDRATLALVERQGREIAELRAERHSTNDKFIEMTVACRKAEARVVELEAAAEAEGTAQWLAGYGFAREQLAAAEERALESGAAELDDATPSQVLPLVVDVPVPVVLTELDGPSLANNASARGATGGLRRLLHPLDPGVRS
ncbi:hypothetical protein [Streptomyces sp. RTd22]|uniref:hypothetical protein n=1 Tax=Streptomyces sp. RTd22 TaxID=1841249 RepID=UPI0007C5D9BF|nr:hypothetical protein [Streptomyces sp. RTd22]